MDKHRDEESPVRNSEPASAEFLLLKDRALDVAAEGITIADMCLPDQPLIYVNEGFEVSAIIQGICLILLQFLFLKN